MWQQRRWRTTVGALSAALLIAAPMFAVAQGGGHPLLGEHGLDLEAMDTSIRPGDDFFRYVNGRWLERSPIPADQPGVTRRMQMSERIENRVHAILVQAAQHSLRHPDDSEGQIGTFYRAFMDQQRIERLGARPLLPELSALRHARTREELAMGMGRASHGLESSFFTLTRDIDLRDHRRYVVLVSQGGLGMPDRDYYLEQSFAAQRRAYRNYIARLLALIRWPAPESSADAVMALEIRIAAVSWSRTQSRDPVTTYNPMTLEELTQRAPGIDWQAWLRAAGLADTERLVIAQPNAITGLARLHADAPLPVLRAWQAFHLADNAAPYMSREISDAWFDFHGRALSGQQQMPARWRRAITAISGDIFAGDDRFGSVGTLSWAVGRIYCAQYFPPAARAGIQQLVRLIMDSYHRRLEALDWMSGPTRAEALRKLDTYQVKVGYPDKWRDYGELRLRSDDLLGDVRRVSAAAWEYELAMLHRPVDPAEWAMAPQSNNAYNGSLRDIVMPAGILQPPLFDADADPAYNFGAVGGVIGHELTHGFDDEGRRVDALGELRDWWAPADAAQFESRTARLSAQYAAFHPIGADPSLHINGDLTLGENIADLGGLSLALDAYRTSLHGQPSALVDGFTGDQRVFLGWAQAWAGQYRDDVVRRQLVSDPHSPRRFRVNGVVRNIDAWYEAFQVTPDEALYLAPDERVHIW